MRPRATRTHATPPFAVTCVTRSWTYASAEPPFKPWSTRTTGAPGFWVSGRATSNATASSSARPPRRAKPAAPSGAGALATRSQRRAYATGGSFGENNKNGTSVARSPPAHHPVGGGCRVSVSRRRLASSRFRAVSACRKTTPSSGFRPIRWRTSAPMSAQASAGNACKTDQTTGQSTRGRSRPSVVSTAGAASSNGYAGDVLRQSLAKHASSSSSSSSAAISTTSIASARFAFSRPARRLASAFASARRGASRDVHSRCALELRDARWPSVVRRVAVTWRSPVRRGARLLLSAQKFDESCATTGQFVTARARAGRNRETSATTVAEGQKCDSSASRRRSRSRPHGPSKTRRSDTCDDGRTMARARGATPRAARGSKRSAPWTSAAASRWTAWASTTRKGRSSR
mmetsp:Transcript_16982/g.52919  ORF Transcript_16982/g.52919 Transcript_16982/m.52919 type:complete len:404 (+) Transcript_16982:623-1834(+)